MDTGREEGGNHATALTQGNSLCHHVPGSGAQMSANKAHVRIENTTTIEKTGAHDSLGAQSTSPDLFCGLRTNLTRFLCLTVLETIP